MRRDYNAKDLGIQALIGRKVLAAFINDEKDAIKLETDKGDLFLRWEGDCCAHCYIAHINGSEFLIGHTILSAENTEWKDLTRNENEYDVLESMGTKIKTDKGYVDIETRVNHNGYYGGRVNVSDVGYIDAYSYIEVADVNKPLGDL